MPGDLDASIFIQAIRYESYEMPPKGKLADDEIKAFEKWIAMGAPWPDGDEPTDSNVIATFDLQKRKSEHWAWQPITTPELPTIANKNWPRSPLDHFLLAKLEAQGLKPADDIDRAGLVRRMYLI